MNRDVILARLSLDSYNRGYGARISNMVEGGAVGGAAVRAFSIGEQDGWQDASFYAAAYQWNDEKVISCRGTDSLNPFVVASTDFQFAGGVAGRRAA